MDAVHPDFNKRALTGFLDRFLAVLLGLAHDLFDAPRMDAPIGDQPLQRDPGDLASNRIVARDDARLGSIVNDDIDAGRSFDRADVAALATYDAPLHLVGRQRDHRDRALGHALPRQPPDRDRDDSLRAAIGLLPRPLLHDADVTCRFARRL